MGKRIRKDSRILVALLVFCLSMSGLSSLNAQVVNQAGVIDATKLPLIFAGFLQKVGGRMLNAAAAQVSLTGVTTDENGSRPAQITLQAPGLFSYREGQTRSLTFNGTSFQSKAGQIATGDERVLESLLADFPDSVCMQVANGGGLRTIGHHFRTDDGRTSNYSGPYWTVLAFGPNQRPGLAAGKALQQSIFIAFDEQTGFLSEVRTVANIRSGLNNVTQTQFTNWAQQGGQWYPSQIIRLENGSQVLSFNVQQVSVGAAVAPAAFAP